jgi:hypothetical protein
MILVGIGGWMFKLCRGTFPGHGAASTDHYSLKGLSQAVERVDREC